MQMIEVSTLKDHPRNTEFFDNIVGDKWDDFKKSIIRRGVVEGVVVTQDLIIVSGHQRVRACRELGILEVPCRITHYKDFDDNTGTPKEDMILEDLICTNIMQRGVGNVNAQKMCKCIMELERIYGIRQGSAGSSDTDNLNGKTQKELAENIGVSQQQLQDYKKLNDLIPELQSLIESGSMKATVGYKIWAKMPQEEQEKFFNEIGRDKIKTLTQKATEEYITKNRELEQQLKQEQSKPPKIIEKEIEVDNTDYTIASKAKKLEENLNNKNIEIEKLKRKLELIEDKANAYEQDSNDYKKMKQDITYLTNQKDDLGRQVQAITDISALVVEVDYLIKGKLAPVRYSKSIREANSDEIVIRNLSEIINVVEGWCIEMKQYLPIENNYINANVVEVL